MYDVVVIGAGWAGFNAAVSAKKAGLTVALIEQGLIGGTCLNRGCIPTKTFLQAAKVRTLIAKAKAFGLAAEPSAEISLPELVARKEKIIQQLRRGMEFMLKGVEIISAEAKLKDARTVIAGGKEFAAKHILIASGSQPLELKAFPFDSKRILSSNEILSLHTKPGTLLIIGGGVIGCEFAQFFSALGVKVTVVELASQLLPGEDADAARKLETIFKKKGIEVLVNTDASKLNTQSYERILVSVGRKPCGDDLGLREIGGEVLRGAVTTDEYLETSVKGVFAAGDCTGKVMLAHAAAFFGNTSVFNMLHPEGKKSIKGANIPSCIFTDPEIASVGMNEISAKQAGYEVAVHMFDFLASGMARIADETEGFIKIVSDAKNAEIIGASLIGPRATELVGILAVAVQSRMKLEFLKEVILPHPTFSEAIHEALSK